MRNKFVIFRWKKHFIFIAALIVLKIMIWILLARYILNSRLYIDDDMLVDRLTWEVNLDLMKILSKCEEVCVV